MTNSTYNVVQITATAAVPQSITSQSTVVSGVVTQGAAMTANASHGQLFAGLGSDNFVFAANTGNGPAASSPPTQGHVELNQTFAAAVLDPAAWHLPAGFEVGASLSPSGPGVGAAHHLHDFQIL